MQIFQCRACGSRLYFGNRLCLGCGRQTAYLAEGVAMVAVDIGNDGAPLPLADVDRSRRWRHCLHRANDDACFWLVDEADGTPLCRSCRLSVLIPDLSDPINHARWKRVEAAKQWLIHSLLELRLPFERETSGVPPLEFHLLSAQPGHRVITGHQESLITIDVAEADDEIRLRRRASLGEPYRTLLGHLRHEVGHYYWQVLASRPGFFDGFRSLFGDEGVDYSQSLDRHYQQGAVSDWQGRYISAYASSHPWEDWAESWAHFMHVVDAVDTARAHRLRLDDVLEPAGLYGPWPPDGETLLDLWQPVSLLINDLNRAVGMPDAYPFVVSPTVRDKIAFVSAQARALASPG